MLAVDRAGFSLVHAFDAPSMARILLARRLVPSLFFLPAGAEERGESVPDQDRTHFRLRRHTARAQRTRLTVAGASAIDRAIGRGGRCGSMQNLPGGTSHAIFVLVIFEAPGWNALIAFLT